MFYPPFWTSASPFTPVILTLNAVKGKNLGEGEATLTSFFPLYKYAIIN
jgi:hypothetical protein